MHSKRYKQYLCAGSVALLSTANFMHSSWTSPTIPLLTSPGSPIGVQLTDEEASWIASTKSVGMLAGGLFVGMVMDKIGRKKTLILASLLIFISWIIIMFSVSFAMLIAARILSGIGGSFATGVMPIYIGEIADKDIRGRLGTLIPFGGTISSMIVFSIGPFASFTTLALICSATPVLFFLIFVFMPESPYYLVKNSKREAAHEVLRTLSQATDCSKKLEEIETTVRQDEACKVTVKSLFLEPSYRKSIGLTIALKTLHQFSGAFAINAYLQTIMEESQTSISAEISSVIFAGIQIPCVLLSAYLTDKVGRRPLLIISATGCAIALIGEGIYFYLLRLQSVDLTSVFFLPTLCLTFYYIMVSLGVSNLLYVITGELFANNVKKVGGTVFASYSGLLTFTSVKIFNPISETWGMHVMFWMFASVCILGVLLGLFLLPETKGKTFDEIQDMLHGRKKNKEKGFP